MKTEPLDEFESQLAAARTSGAPAELRRAVLGNVERELRASRWDRRMARVAIVLLAVGIGMNASVALRESRPQGSPSGLIARDRAADSLIEAAIVVTEATDAETGRQFARQLAALSGRELTDQEIASIDAAATRDRG
jgi:hypothetical protein